MKKTTLILSSIALLATISLGLVSCSKKESGNTANSSTEQKKPDRFLPIDSVTIYGDKIDSEYFKKNDLTLINIMATWCGPCVKEMPELQEINAEDNGFGVIGIVVDTYDEATGNSIAEAIEEAKNIASKTGVEYPLTIPTQDFLEATLKKVAALLPMSYIVDQNGKIVKGPVAGARSKAEWLDLLNSVKAGL